MPATQITGSRQIKAASITADRFVASLNLPTSQLADGALFLKKDGSVVLTADLNLGGFLAKNSGTPTAAGDLVNKAYVDAVAQGLQAKPAVDAVVTTNLATLSGTGTFGGVALAAADTVLLVNQTTASQNGPWVVAAGAWTRPTWFAAASNQAEGAYILVERGTGAGNGYVNTTQGVTVVDTTATSWQIFSSASTITAGNGIAIAGNSVSVKAGIGLAFDGSQNVVVQPNGASLNVAAGGVKIADGTPGQVMIANASNAAGFATLTGDVDSVSGAGAVTLASSVRKSANFVYNAVPATGSADGTNTAFTLGATPVAGTVCVYEEGQRLFPGAGNDYTISAGTITFVSAPPSGVRITFDYQT